MSNNCYYQIIVVATVGIGCGLLSWFPAPTDAVRYVPKWKKQVGMGKFKQRLCAIFCNGFSPLASVMPSFEN